MPQGRVLVDLLRIVQLLARQESILDLQSTPQRLRLEHEAPTRGRLRQMIDIPAALELDVVLHLPAGLLQRQKRLRCLLLTPSTVTPAPHMIGRKLADEPNDPKSAPRMKAKPSQPKLECTYNAISSSTSSTSPSADTILR